MYTNQARLSHHHGRPFLAADGTAHVCRTNVDAFFGQLVLWCVRQVHNPPHEHKKTDRQVERPINHLLFGRRRLSEEICWKMRTK